MHKQRIWEPPTAAFADRLKRALKTAPSRIARRVTVQQFAKLLAEGASTGQKVPSSYRSLMLYLHDKRKPRDSTFAKRAAQVLAVRWQWLHSGQEPMTATEVTYTTLTATAKPTIVLARRSNVAGQPAGPDATVAEIRQLAEPIADFPAGLASFVEVWDRCVGSSPVLPDSDQQFRIARQLWQLITAPLEMLGVSPAAPLHYYTTVLSALMIAVPGPGQGRDLSAKSPTKRRNS